MSRFHLSIIAAVACVLGFAFLLNRYAPKPVPSMTGNAPASGDGVAASPAPEVARPGEPLIVPSEPVAVASVREAEPPRQALVLTDIYTTEAAAEQAYIERVKAEALAQQVFGSTSEGGASDGDARIPETFAGLFDSFIDPSMLQDEDDARPDRLWTAETDLPLTAQSVEQAAAAQRDVDRVVNGFLRLAFAGHDADQYLAALDVDYQYTHNGGTPNDASDDRYHRGIEYEAIGINRLMARYTDAAVRLSRPQDFELIRPGVAQVTYDYDMRLANAVESRRVAGTATFLLMRGGTTGTSPDWRIVEWYDSPPVVRAR